MTLGDVNVVFEERRFREDTQELEGVLRVYRNHVLINDTEEAFINTDPGMLRQLVKQLAIRALQENY